MKNKCIINTYTNELIAYISDEHENIVKDGYEIIEYGSNEPIFEDRNGDIFVKSNTWLM